MAGPFRHLRSSTANKRPAASGIADGQLGINTASGTPALFFKDNAGTIVKVGPAHVGASAPNVSPAGSAGNSLGELWVDNSGTVHGLNYFNGSAFVNLTPSGTTSAAGLVELASSAEVQTGTDPSRVVTPSGLQSKVSDSTSTSSSTTIASSTAVKTAYDLANAALPMSGGSITGELRIAPSGSFVFEGSSDDSFETAIAVVNPTADRTITLPNTTGTVVTTGDSGTITSTMIADDTIVNADINASAAIADTKLATISTAGKVSNSATTATSSNTANAIVARDASGNFTANVITANLTGTASAIADSTVTSAKIVDGAIVNADVNASAAIAGTKISPDFGSQNITTTGLFSHALGTAGTPTITFTGDTNTGIYSPGADQVAISTNGTGRLFVDANGRVGIGTTAPLDRLHIASTGECKLIIGNEQTNTDGIKRSAIIKKADNDLEIRATESAVAGATIFTRTVSAESARIDSSGRLLVGTSSSRSQAGYTPTIQLEGTSASATYGIVRSSDNSGGPGIGLAKARGSSVGSTTAVIDGDNLGSITFAGANGTDLSNVAASIDVYVDGTPFSSGDTTDLPGRLVFSVTADGASSPTEAMRIKNSRIINFANTPVYADNAAAKTGGLVDGDVYRKSDGTLMIVYT